MTPWSGRALCVLSLALASAGAHPQDGAGAGAPPEYTKAEFGADRSLVVRALGRAAELASQHDFEGAVAALDEALEAVRPASLRVTLWLERADLHVVQGRLAAASADLDAAQRTLDGIDAATRARERCASLACYLAGQRGRVALDQGLVDLAWQQVQQARSLLPPRAESEGARAADFDRERIFLDHLEARVLTSMEDYRALESHVLTAVEDPVYAKYPGHDARLLALLGLGLKESARTEPADRERARECLLRALGDEYFMGLDRVLPELALGEIALRASEWDEAQVRLDAAAEAMGPEDARASLPHATAWTALAARLRVERTDRPASRAELEQARDETERLLSDRIAEWSRRELRPGGYGPLQYADQQSLVSELMRLDMLLEEGPAGIERALGRSLTAEGASTLARKLAAPAASLASARKQLLGDDPRRALLVYFPAPDRTHLFVIDRRAVDHFFLPAADFVELARRSADATLRRPLPANAADWLRAERADALANLSRTLLPPDVRARLTDSERWTIVGDDLLGPVPFEALELDGGWLGTKRALDRLPSLAVGLRLAERARRDGAPRAPAEDDSLVLAAPLGDAGKPGRADFEELVAAYPEGASSLVVGADAGPRALTEWFGRVRVAQVLAHGSFDERRAQPAGMLLAGDAPDAVVFVGAEELERTAAPPLVVLTVCGAGAAPKRRGDAGAADLAGALFASGERSRCVVQSSYDLDVESARRISAAFHRSLLGGASPAEALRSARAELASDERFADPFHHASITVVGLGHEPLFAP